MGFLCLLWLHSWELKTKIVEKSWFLVNFLEQNGFNPEPIEIEQIKVNFKECRRCGKIKPR